MAPAPLCLDTHCIVWYAAGSPRLGPLARRHIDDALEARAILLPAQAIYEMAWLEARGRIVFSRSVENVIATLLASGASIAPTTFEVALTAARLDIDHGDPGDRLIAACAAVAGAALMTADETLLDWKTTLRRLDARV